MAFQDLVAEAARARVHAEARTNLVLQRYHFALQGATLESKSKDAFIERKRKEFHEVSSKLIADRELLLQRAKRRQIQVAELKSKVDELEAKIAEFDMEKAKFVSEKDAEVERLRESRIYEATLERLKVDSTLRECQSAIAKRVREYLSKRDEYEEKRSLQGQASGTLDCLEALKKNGVLIPQSVIDIFVGEKAKYEAEAEAAKVEDLSEDDLLLPPLPSELHSPYVDLGLLQSFRETGLPHSSIAHSTPSPPRQTNEEGDQEAEDGEQRETAEEEGDGTRQEDEEQREAADEEGDGAHQGDEEPHDQGEKDGEALEEARDGDE